MLEWCDHKDPVDLCIYHIILDKCTAYPMVVFVPDTEVLKIAGTLKNLSNNFQIMAVTPKSQRNQVKKGLQDLMRKSGIAVITPGVSQFVQSCMPSSCSFNTVIHAECITSAAELQRRNLLLNNLDSANTKQIICCRSTTNIETAGHYEVNRSWLPTLQCRMSTARKLYESEFEGQLLISKKNANDQTTINTDHLRQALACKISALKNKVKVLLSSTIAGSREAALVLGLESELSSPITSLINVNTNNRAKLELLGMVAPVMGSEMHNKAEVGRALAMSRWLDCAPGNRLLTLAESLSLSSSLTSDAKPNTTESYGYDCGHACEWRSVRYGASSDSSSRAVCSVIQQFRAFVAHKCGTSHMQLPKRWDEAKLLSSRQQLRMSQQCRVVGFGWRPSARGDDEWGGEYGRSCGHNEVSMFYERPFFPLEVLNTHVCSLQSPAPGNEGYDGCLEFLIAQCRFFSRAMTIWDDQYFLFIDATGGCTSVPKKCLLVWPLHRLQVMVPNLRHETVACLGDRNTTDILDTIDVYLQIASGVLRIGPLGGRKLSKYIGGYLLVGSAASWTKASLPRNSPLSLTRPWM